MEHKFTNHRWRAGIAIGAALAITAGTAVMSPAASAAPASGSPDCVSNRACGWVDAFAGGPTTWHASTNGNYQLPASYDNKFSSVYSVHSGCTYYRDFSGSTLYIRLPQNTYYGNLGTDVPQIQDKISYVQLLGGAC